MVELRLAGYFPKQIVARPQWLNAPNVEDICSISRCISRGPERWMDLGLHNRLDFFDTPDLALGAASGSGWRLFAYRLLSVRFREGVEEFWSWPTLATVPLAPDFRSLGFDVASQSMTDTLECSPLSCNGAAERWAVNTHCLLDSLEGAIEAARRFSIDGAEPVEPGDYYVAEVLCADKP